MRGYSANAKPLSKSARVRCGPTKTVVLTCNGTIYRLTPAEAAALAKELAAAAEAGTALLERPQGAA